MLPERQRRLDKASAKILAENGVFPMATPILCWSILRCEPRSCAGFSSLLVVLYIGTLQSHS